MSVQCKVFYKDEFRHVRVSTPRELDLFVRKHFGCHAYHMFAHDSNMVKYETSSWRLNWEVFPFDNSQTRSDEIQINWNTFPCGWETGLVRIEVVELRYTSSKPEPIMIGSMVTVIAQGPSFLRMARVVDIIDGGKNLVLRFKASNEPKYRMDICNEGDVKVGNGWWMEAPSSFYSELDFADEDDVAEDGRVIPYDPRAPSYHPDHGFFSEDRCDVQPAIASSLSAPDEVVVDEVSPLPLASSAEPPCLPIDSPPVDSSPLVSPPVSAAVAPSLVAAPKPRGAVPKSKVTGRKMMWRNGQWNEPDEACVVSPPVHTPDTTRTISSLPPKKRIVQPMPPSAGPLPISHLVDFLRADAELQSSLDAATWRRFDDHFAQYEAKQITRKPFIDGLCEIVGKLKVLQAVKAAAAQVKANTTPAAPVAGVKRSLPLTPSASQMVHLTGKDPVMGDVYHFTYTHDGAVFTLEVVLHQELYDSIDWSDRSILVTLPRGVPSPVPIVAKKHHFGRLKYTLAEIPEKVVDALKPQVDALREQRRSKGGKAPNSQYRNVYLRKGAWFVERKIGADSFRRLGLTDDEDVAAIIAAASYVDPDHIYSISTAHSWMNHIHAASDDEISAWIASVNFAHMP